MSDCGYEIPQLKDYMDHLRKLAYEQKLPLQGIFELTPRCNFNCSMCYIHLQPEEIARAGRERTKEEWISLAKAARDSGTLELTLTGGELFLHPDFRAIYEAIAEMGFFIQLFSNGYLFDEEMVEWLAKRPPYAVRFTLYGASDETYEAVCGVRDGFAKVKKALELLKKAGILTYLVATITRENEKDLKDMMAFAKENGILFGHTSSLILPVRGASTDPKAHQVADRALSVEEREVVRQSGRFPRKPAERLADTCGNYRKCYWITWDGNMQLCTFLTKPSVPVSGQDFRTSWEALLEEVGQLKPPDQCGICEWSGYCDRCPGLLHAEGDGSGKPPESLCSKARYLFEVCEG